MSAAVVAGVGQRRAAAGARGAAQQDVDDRGCRAARAAPSPTSRGRRVDGLAQLLRGDGRPGRQRERQLRERPAVLGLALADDRPRSGRLGSSHLDDLGVARGAPVRVVGEPGRRRRVVEREHARSSSPPAASAPVSFTQRWFFRARDDGRCQSLTTSALSARNTSLVSPHSSTGLFSRSKCAHQNGLSSRRWYPRAAAIIATAVCSGVRAVDAVAGERHQRAGELVGVLDRRRRRRPAAGPAAARRTRSRSCISQSRSRCVDRQS